MRSIPLDLVAHLIEPHRPRGLFGYQIGSFDENKQWRPLVIVSSKFASVSEASAKAQKQLEQTEHALWKRTQARVKRKAKSRKVRKEDGEGPGAA